MKILLLDRYDETHVFESEEDFLQYCEDNETDFDYRDGSGKPEAFYLPDNLEKVKVEQVPSRYAIKRDPDSTEIPAPRPGETVSDYARRITGA